MARHRDRKKEEKRRGGSTPTQAFSPPKVSSTIPQESILIDKIFDEPRPSVDPLFQAAFDNLSESELINKKSLDQERLSTRAQVKKNHGSDDVIIDLHGKNLESAFRMIDRVFNAPHEKREINYKIITGRGLHSPVSGVLVHEVYQYVVQRYSLRISAISADPSTLTRGGMPMKGYFTVRLKRG